jgi:hypothetical protein
MTYFAPNIHNFRKMLQVSVYVNRMQRTFQNCYALLTFPNLRRPSQKSTVFLRTQAKITKVSYISTVITRSVLPREFKNLHV